MSVFSVAPCSQVPGTVFSSCGPSCPRSCEDLAVGITLNMTLVFNRLTRSHVNERWRLLVTIKTFLFLSPSTVSGNVSRGATVQRGRSCLLTGLSVWTERTVPAWTSTLDKRWNQGRPLKPLMDVTTGQHNAHCACMYNTSHNQKKRNRKIIMLVFPLCFSTCDGGRLNCSRDPCPGE